MFGGHLPWNDELTLSLITNDEILAVDQHSRNNHQLFRQGDLVAWVADVPDSADKYLALFNARDPEDASDPSKTVTVTASLADLGISGAVRVRDLWTHTDLGVFEKSFSRDLRSHSAGLYRVSPVPRVP